MRIYWWFCKLCVRWYIESLKTEGKTEAKTSHFGSKIVVLLSIDSHFQKLCFSVQFVLTYSFHSRPPPSFLTQQIQACPQSCTAACLVVTPMHSSLSYGPKQPNQRKKLCLGIMERINRIQQLVHGGIRVPQRRNIPVFVRPIYRSFVEPLSISARIRYLLRCKHAFCTLFI